MNFSKIVSLEALCALVDSLKKQGKKIVYAHGAFDLLHAGHIHHLEEAKKLDIPVAIIGESFKFRHKSQKDKYNTHRLSL